MCLLFSVLAGFLKQFRATAACREESAVTEAEEEPANDSQLYNSIPAASANQNQQHMVEHQKSNISALMEQAPVTAATHEIKVGENSNGQVKCVDNVGNMLSHGEEKVKKVFSPSEGLPTHNKPSSARPKSGKVLKRKNTPALLPKVEKLYGEFVIQMIHQCFFRKQI